jgi:hypothetical protein
VSARSGPDAGSAPSGAAFWLSTALGAAIAGFGTWGLLSNLHGPALESWLKVLAGGLVAHDALFAPLVIVGSVLLARVVPARVRAPVQGALIVSGALVAVAIPVVGGFGRQATNPSLLPSDHYAARLLVALGVVWAIAAILAVARLRRPAARPPAG